MARQPAALTSTEREALALFKEADRRYAEGRYEEAAELFTKAYAKSPQPLLLYNLANTYERMGAYAKAADALAKYVATGRPEASAADTLRQRERQIRLRADVAAQHRAELDKLRARPSSCPDCSLVPDREGPAATPYILFAAGGVTLVSAVVFAAMARSAGDDANKNCVGGTGGRFCSIEADSAIDRERRFALFTDVSTGIGVAALGFGAYLYLRDKKRRDRRDALARTRIVPAVTANRIGLAVSGEF